MDLDDRRRALEAVFFRQRDEELLARIRAERAECEEAESLARMCGVRDPEVLRPLVRHGVTAETFAALVVVPLVAVAWADDKLSVLERQEIVADAHRYGMEAGGPCGELLERWIEEPPDPGLVDAWVAYARSLADCLPEDERAALEREVLGRARDVARADGGVLRIGRLVSRAEREVLDRLAAALRGEKEEE